MTEAAWTIGITAGLFGTTMLILFLNKPGRRDRPRPRADLSFSPGDLIMRGRMVGWIRTHWRHWEPIVWGEDTSDVWDQLRAFPSSDEDGERVVLPHGERPVELIARDLP